MFYYATEKQNQRKADGAALSNFPLHVPAYAINTPMFYDPSLVPMDSDSKDEQDSIY